MELRLRICIFTEYGIAGARLSRGVPLPNGGKFDFPCTDEGKREAEECMEKLNDYAMRHHGKNK